MLYTNCYVTLNLKPLRNLISCKKENTLCQALSYSSLYTRELKVMVLYQPFQNRTIPRKSPTPLPYERSVGFASLQSPWAFNFWHPCPSLVKGEVLSPERIRATTGGIAFLPHPFRFSDTSVNNPSVTVTEKTILCQRIFNFYKKQY